MAGGAGVGGNESQPEPQGAGRSQDGPMLPSLTCLMTILPGTAHSSDTWCVRRESATKLCFIHGKVRCWVCRMKVCCAQVHACMQEDEVAQPVYAQRLARYLTSRGCPSLHLSGAVCVQIVGCGVHRGGWRALLQVALHSIRSACSMRVALDLRGDRMVGRVGLSEQGVLQLAES